MGAVEFSLDKARKAQVYIAKKVICEDRLREEIKLVGGVDVAYYEDWAVGAAVVLDYENLSCGNANRHPEGEVSLCSHSVCVP
jgi:deoxyinosine 3'endonuclease (endonuclease V)